MLLELKEGYALLSLCDLCLSVELVCVLMQSTCFYDIS